MKLKIKQDNFEFTYETTDPALEAMYQANPKRFEFYFDFIRKPMTLVIG